MNHLIMDLQTIASQLEILFNTIDKAMNMFQEAKTDYENLNNHTKTILAQTSGKYTGSEAERTRLALADQDYITHLEALKLTRQQYNRTSALVQGLELKLKILQSLGKHLNLTNI